MGLERYIRFAGFVRLWIESTAWGFQLLASRKAPQPTALVWLSGVCTGGASREALIKSLSDFILGFLCNARNNSTRIASYLRRVMTKQCIKILIKSDSAN